MNKQDIQLLYRYNHWANERILNAAANVTTEQFLVPGSYPHGGLRGTLAHALSSECTWRKRWQGESPAQGIKPEEFPTFDSLRARWQEEEKSLAAFVDNLTDDRLNAPFQYKTLRGDPMENVLWQVMVHMVNHGTQHRSEAAAMLTELGHSPGDIDFIIFLREIQKSG
ncbi:hypothetical protein ANAEL_03246 [Anaerolineales bacterium]|nr:hypothetical protein ANAEL_03246 [Anaerolineales bacterium]